MVEHGQFFKETAIGLDLDNGVGGVGEKPPVEAKKKVGRPRGPYKKKKRNIEPLHKDKEPITLTISFEARKELFDKLFDAASKDFRTMEEQVLYFIHRGIEEW